MSRYQSSSTTKYNASDNRLDELLEDLQSTVSRPKLNGTAGGNASSYREVIKTSSSQRNGQPAETTKHYEYETSKAPERPKSPFDKEQTNGGPGKGYKTVSYEYSSSKRSGNQTSGGTSLAENKFEKHNGKPEVKFRENINELDTLLNDLNHTQKSAEYSSSSSSHVNRYKNYDSGFIEPLDHSTPQKSSHVSKIEQKSFEERYGNSSPIRHTEIKKEVYQDGQPVERFVDKYSSGTSDVKKDLVFTGGSFRHREPSPARQLQQQEKMYHYETKSSSTKKSAEVPPPRTVSRNYNYESDVTDHAIPYNRSPSPIRATQQHYSSSNTVKESTTHRSPSPVRSYYSTTSTVTRNLTPQPTRHVFSANKSIQEKRETTSRRSPSPIEPPVETSTNSYNYERSVRPQAPLPLPSREIPPGATIITRNYKYSSESRKNTTYPAEPVPYAPPARPFPSPSPQPEIREQNPPKQLDELMASFSDSESHYKQSYNAYSDRYHSTEKVQSKSPSPPKTPEKIVPVQSEKTYECTKTNGVAGPPVYYPPGPLFSKKEECSVVEEKNLKGKGNYEASREAMYKYEAGGKTKEVGKRKKTVVPLCAPVCCALPCAVM